MAKKKDHAEISAVLAELPQTPSQEVVDAVKGRLKGDRLVYRAGYYTEPLTGLKQKAAQVHCTACGRDFYLSYYRCTPCHNGGGVDAFGFYDPLDNEPKQTGSTCICPECGAEAQALHIGHISSTGTAIASGYFMTLHNVRGHFVALGWQIFKEVDKDGRIYFTVRRYEGVGIIDGRPVRFSGYKHVIYSLSWNTRWEARARWQDRCDEWDADEIFLTDADAFEGTEIAKSALDVFIKDGKTHVRVGAYLHLWTRFPNVENLVRSGLTPYVKSLIQYGTHTSYYGYNAYTGFSVAEAAKHINTKVAKPFLMLGIEKTEIPLARELDVAELDYYKQTKARRGVRLTAEQLHMLKGFGFKSFEGMLAAAEETGNRLPMIRALNYLKKQRAVEEARAIRQTDAHLITPVYLRDYWYMLTKARGRVPAELLLPKDLIAAHDKAQAEVKEKEDRELSEKIASQAKKNAELCFEDADTGLLIRPAATHRELIREGEKLHHCVAGYAHQVANGTSLILLIRHIDKPDEPFFTLEWKNGKVAQNRGLRNCARTPEVTAFEAKWLDYIKELKNNAKWTGKQAAADQCERACA